MYSSLPFHCPSSKIFFIFSTCCKKCRTGRNSRTWQSRKPCNVFLRNYCVKLLQQQCLICKLCVLCALQALRWPVSLGAMDIVHVADGLGQSGDRRILWLLSKKKATMILTIKGAYLFNQYFQKEWLIQSQKLVHAVSNVVCLIMGTICTHNQTLDCKCVHLYRTSVDAFTIQTFGCNCFATEYIQTNVFFLTFQTIFTT